ncbi:hypothetical protein [Natrialbaceae archaeon AArc-T1-2]|uniref:hypothetical protein n=1 Tax=Natrialbaceae archaeon AArc-T1-2 TaxID=3053904 RepID=UPI00255B36FA|nr:hypothetical protein [Natrialbaceae archaeon AArc-T1-2]WIV65997.1 hypothetical protein QQ977_09845 [Natrialbaceae archaeon AArc-T1-2]
MDTDRLLVGRRSNRRTFLLASSVAVSAFAGCLGNGEGEEGAPDGGDADNGDENEDDENGEEDTDDGGSVRSEPSPPTPDFTVAKDGPSDYDTLQEAYESLDSGDVIGVGPGTYTLQPDVEYLSDVDGEMLTKTFSYVGESADETTIELIFPEASSFTVRAPHRFPEECAPAFWQATLEVPAEMSYSRSEHDQFEAITANYCTIDGSFGGPTDAYDTDFTDSISHEVDAVRCRFHEDVGGPGIFADVCQFNGTVDSDGGIIRDSTIEGVFDLNSVNARQCELEQGVRITGNGTLEECVVDPLPGSEVAIDIRSRYERAIVTGCEIHGSVRSDRDRWYIGRFELNTFDVPSSVRYIIDGAPATDIYPNAFLNGDVRISTGGGGPSGFPVEELDLYGHDPADDEPRWDRNLGNYYSEWDGADGDPGDVADGTRTLPGPDGVMDRYPLATPDLEAYLEDD